MELNLIAPISKYTSYGYVSQNIIKQFIKHGIKVNLKPIGPIVIDTEAGYSEYIEQCNNQLSDNPNVPNLIIFHHFALKQHIRPNQVNVGFPIFEVNHFNQEEIDNLQSVNRLFITCKWYQRVLDKFVKTHSDIVNLGYDEDIFYSENKDSTNVPSSANTSQVRFLNIGKWEIRKGHDILARAFGEVFKDIDDVSLTLASTNDFIGQDNNKWLNYCKLFVKPEQLNIAPRLDSAVQVAALIRSHDVGVYPSRAEGWNMGLLECLAMDKLCIATNYSAHTEYINKGNCAQIEIFEEEPAFDGQFFFGNGTWASLKGKSYEQLKECLLDAYKTIRERCSYPQPENQINQFTWANSVKHMKQLLF